MCIIIAKDKSGRLPSKKELENSFNYNSDGAGLMYVDNGKVHIHKGFMTFNSFYKHYKKLLIKYNNFKDKSLVLHFRIGTSSGNTPKNTHPYPVSSNEKDLHKLFMTTDLAIAHNGIISDYTPENKNASKTNDTQEFIMKYISPIYKHYKLFYLNKYLLNGMESITNSKLVFLDKNDNLYYVGDFINDNNLKFSNDSYERNIYSYYGGYHYHNSTLWNDYEEKDNDIPSELIGLDNAWYIEYEDTFEDVGNRDLYYDIDNMALYRCENDKMILWKDFARVYDENYEEIISY